MMPDPGLHLDLDTLARKVIHRVDRRYQVPPSQPVTRVATRMNGAVTSNRHRAINVKSQGVTAASNNADSCIDLAIPCGYLYCVVDGGSSPIVFSTIPQTSVHVHDNLTVVQWTVIANISGSITFDLRHSTFLAYPSTTSIISGTHPNLSSSIKNKSTDYIDPATGEVNVLWTPLGWANLAIDDVLDVLVTASSIVQKVTLILQCQAS